MHTLSGMSIYEAIGDGIALVLTKPTARYDFIDQNSFDCDLEMKKFNNASQAFVLRLRRAMAGPAPDKVRDLFGACSGFLSDKQNILDIMTNIKNGFSATQASNIVLLRNLEMFKQSDDSELNEQGRELNALIREFIGTLNQEKDIAYSVPLLTEPSVIIAEDLTPARFLCLRTDLVRAVVLEGGLSSGHLSTVLRELKIPSMFSVMGATNINNGEHVLVDANNATVFVEPPKDTAQRILQGSNNITDDLVEDTSEIPLVVASSIGAIRDINQGSYLKHGIGLLRSEFLFLGSNKEPSELEMIEKFSQLFKNTPTDAPISARTFDFAGDKQPVFLVSTDKQGPLKGYGARVGTELLKKEIRALLQAAANREINIVFPLITRISEAQYLKELLHICTTELVEEQKAIAKTNIALMIETPAAVLSAKAFAKLASMFIIGTSSLAEYASAPREPEGTFTPALAKMIALACKACVSENVKIGLAGRYAIRVELLPLFLGLGVEYITSEPSSIVKVRQNIEKILDTKEAKFDIDLYNKIMDISTGPELIDLINNLHYN